MDCLKNCVIIIPAKLCNQRNFFSHDVELNNKGILQLHFTFILILLGLFLSSAVAGMFLKIIIPLCPVLD